MSKNQLACVVLVSLASACAVSAQEPSIQLPKGNFLCTVEVIPREPEATPLPGVTPPAIEKKRVITTVGNIRRDQIVWSDNASTELWTLLAERIGAFEQRGAGGIKYPAVADGVLLDSVCPKLLRLDPDSVSWIKPDKLQNKEAIGSGTPLHYKTEIVQQVIKSEEPGVPDTPAKTTVYQAWIDAKTLLPLKFDDGDASYTLAFAPEAPVTPLQVPAHLQTELNRWKSALATRPHL